MHIHTKKVVCWRKLKKIGCNLWAGVLSHDLTVCRERNLNSLPPQISGYILTDTTIYTYNSTISLKGYVFLLFLCESDVFLASFLMGFLILWKSWNFVCFLWVSWLNFLWGLLVFVFWDLGFDPFWFLGVCVCISCWFVMYWLMSRCVGLFLL